jgi:4-amino-4-deoxy-L-arabinose transferase-like glycosyltransferase
MALPVDRSAVRVRAVAFCLAWLLPCLAVQLLFFRTQFTGLVMVDAMDAAQVARHISQGDGFTTSFIRPLSLGLVPRVTSHPDLNNPPLQPLILAVAFNLFGASDRTVGMVSLLFAVLTTAMTYLLGARLLDNHVGALAALLVTLTIGLLKAGVAGIGVSCTAFLLALLFFAVVQHRGTAMWSALCGAIAALAYLTDYGVLLLAAVACALVALSRPARRLQHAALFAAGFLLLNMPWAVRNWSVAGSPIAGMKLYSVAMWGATNPATTLYRQQSPAGAGPITFAAGHLTEVIKKSLLSLNEFESMLATAFGIVLLPLFGIALFTDLGSVGANRLKWAVLLGLVLAGLSAAVGRPRFDFVYCALGVVAALGAMGVVLVLRRRNIGSTATAGAVAALLAVSAYPISLNALPGSRPGKPDRRNLDYIGKALPAKAIVVTDQPWSVAWYANRTAVWLPLAVPPQPDENPNMSIADAADATQSRRFLALEKVGVRPSAIYLSSDLLSYPEAEQVGQWQLLHRVLGGQLQAAAQQQQAPTGLWTPKGWSLAATLPPNDFLLVRAQETAAPAQGSQAKPR